MDILQRFLSRAWRPVLVLLSLGFIAYVLYFHRLGSLLPGYAPAEVSAYTEAQSWHQIIHNPVNAPYKIGVWVFALLGHHHLIVTRAVAAACGVAAIAIFFLIARAWYGFRVGLLSSFLFATSAGFLHVVRFGSPQVLQLAALALIGIVIWHRRMPRLHPYLTYILAATLAVLCYIPGMVWLELFATALLYRRAWQYWNRAAIVHRALWAFTFIVLVAPLVAAIAVQPRLGFDALGLPHNLGSALVHFPRHLLDTVLALGAHSNGSALFWVGHAPLFDAAELAFGALGVYYYLTQERTTRSLLLAGFGILALILASLGGPNSIAYVIPIGYLLIAAGLGHFLSEWITVFPRNPFAKGAGLIIVSTVLLFSIAYQTRSYFVAWPHHDATEQAFTVQSH